MEVICMEYKYKFGTGFTDDPLITNIEDKPDNFKVIDVYKHHEVIHTARLAIKREVIQKCKLCGKEMPSFIIDHIRKEHPDDYEKELVEV